MAVFTRRDPRPLPRFASTRAQLARRRRSLLLPILLLVAISLLAAGGVLFWSAGSLNLREAESQEAVVKSMIQLRKDMLRQLVIEYAWWQDPTEARAPDEPWLRESDVAVLYSSFEVSTGWFVSPDGEVALAFENGTQIMPGEQQGSALPSGAVELVDRARNAVSFNKVPEAVFVVYEQELALVAASLIAPVNKVLDPGSYEQSVMVLLHPLELDLLAHQSPGGHLEDIHFIRGPAPPGYLNCPITGVNGVPLGNIVWRDHRPGSQMLWNSMPLLLIALSAVGVLLFLAIRRVETAVSSEGRLSVSLYQEQQRRSQKSDFVSMVSHELRTPLQAIGTSADMLERFGDQMDDKERHEEISTIRQSVATLVRLVEDVLALGRSEAAQQEDGADRRVDLAKFCQAKWREVSIALRSKQPLELDDQIGEPVQGVNELALHTILSNLLQNAIKYSRGEGPVRVSLSCEGGECRLAVTDFGPGIDEDQREAIFQPYWRSQEVGAIAGTGLGLSVARSAAQSMGGDLRLACPGRKSGCGDGTSFIASWPIGPQGREHEMTIK